MIDKLIHMQHYRLPTRQLDVTSNPLLALYICCADMLDITPNTIYPDIKDTVREIARRTKDERATIG